MNCQCLFMCLCVVVQGMSSVIDGDALVKYYKFGTQGK
jgi:hypothetical protein